MIPLSTKVIHTLAQKPRVTSSRLATLRGKFPENKGNVWTKIELKDTEKETTALTQGRSSQTQTRLKPGLPFNATAILPPKLPFTSCHLEIGFLSLPSKRFLPYTAPNRCNPASFRNWVQREARVVQATEASEHSVPEASSWRLLHCALTNEVFTGHCGEYKKYIYVIYDLYIWPQCSSC